MSFHSRDPAADSWRYEFNRWYVEDLRAAGEEPLHPTGALELEIFRFTLSGHNHPTITIRVARSGDAYHVAAKQLTLYEKPAEIDRKTSRPLQAREWGQLVRLIEEASFWDMPSEDPSEIVMLHGWNWLLEGAGGNRYHYVDRGWIRDSPAYVRACLCLIELSELPEARDSPDLRDLTARLAPGCD